MKKVIAIILCVSLLTSLSLVSLADSTDNKYGKYTFRTKYGFAVITAYNGNEETVIIPQTLGEYTVSGVDNNVFSESLKNLYVPENISLFNSSIPDGTNIIGYKNSFAQNYCQYYSGFGFTLLGDADKSGAVDVDDAAAIGEIATGKTAEGLDALAGDVTLDGTVDALDCLSVLLKENASHCIHEYTTKRCDGSATSGHKKVCTKCGAETIYSSHHYVNGICVYCGKNKNEIIIT